MHQPKPRVARADTATLFFLQALPADLSYAQIAPTIDDLTLTNTYDTPANRTLKCPTSIQPILAVTTAPVHKNNLPQARICEGG